MQHWLKEIARGKRGAKDLSYEEALEAARFIAGGKATDAQLAAFFIAERIKTESPQELLAFVQAFQEKCEVIKGLNCIQIDFAGPYTGRNTFAATIPVSLLLADYGISVFMHASDSLPPKYGTSIKDIINELGIEVGKSGPAISEDVKVRKIGFAHSEQLCNPLQQMRRIREEIGVRTILNTAEKLLNLSGAQLLMLGAFHRTAINKMIPTFEGLGYEKVVVVQGEEGSEDVPVHRNSFIYVWTKDSLNSYLINPEDYGLMEEKQEGTLTLKDQCYIIMTILKGEGDKAYPYYYKQVLLNAGIRYYYFGITSSVEEGIRIAKKQLHQKRGLIKLEEWKVGALAT
ncbi:anthranilate phosphoribosyltransferase [Bacillus sp. Marseille-P3661]|uniref:anthranilate phosphoribosyltransferase n=1 Tax=Bacillus sp. Marseille-P3661 TaxID=1936234 RepID=UPI000C83B615|nr:glycosyl transferase [Bacillus sp. Marseille-P3661]